MYLFLPLENSSLVYSNIDVAYIFFFKTPVFNISSPSEIRNKYKNKLMRKSHFVMFRKLQNNVKSFFYKQHFHKQHQTEIWFKN